MLLKAKTFDENKEVLEQFAFTQLRIGGKIGRDQLKPRYFRQSRDWRGEGSGTPRAQLAGTGGASPSPAAGVFTRAQLMRTIGGTSGGGHISLSHGPPARS